MPPKAKLSLLHCDYEILGRKGKAAKSNPVMVMLCSCCHAAQNGTKKLCCAHKWVGLLVQMLPWGFISHAALAFHTFAHYLLNSFPLHCNCEVSSWSGWSIIQADSFRAAVAMQQCACTTAHFSVPHLQYHSLTKQEWYLVTGSLSETPMWAINLVIPDLIDNS